MQHGEQPDDASAASSPGAGGSWERVVERFRGVVAEVDDPLTWGLELDEETVTGAGDREHDPAEERFLRSYVSIRGETLDVETLRVLAADDEQATDIVRTALSGALAAPLHSGVADDDFLDSYQDYRTAMRGIVAEVDQARLERCSFVVDGAAHPCLRVAVRDTAAVYAPVAGRALVVSGPAGLLDRVDVVTRPIRNILHGDDGPRF